MHHKPIPKPVLKQSKRILDGFSLCDSCLGRMHARRLRLVSCRALGSRIRSALGRKKTRGCYVCHDLLDHLDAYVDRLRSLSEDTHYGTFLIGTVLRPSVMDRDDQLRSRFKMRGADGIKGEIARSLTVSFARRTGKAVDAADPDLTFLVNMRTDMCEQRARSVTMRGRYLKTARGLPQKQSPCRDCRGRGCIFCGNRGIAEFESIEGVIARFLYGRFDCARVRFTWVGGEDKDSLVGGGGRPFFAKIINPKKRNARLAKRADLDGGVTLLDLGTAAARIPTDPVRFWSHVVLDVHAQEAITQDSLQDMAVRLVSDPVEITDGGRSIRRRIHSAESAMTSPDSFRMSIIVDGGMPIRRLVDGGGGGGGGGGGVTNPSMSKILKVGCTCTRFDFEDIGVGPPPADGGRRRPPPAAQHPGGAPALK